MCDRYPGYLYGGTPVSSWDRSFNSLENQIQNQYGRRVGATRYWGSMSDGGGVAGAGDSCKTNLIVNYLPQTMTEKDLYAMFMTIGPIESCRVMKDFKTGYSYGFGFVNFTREEDAARAIDTFNGYQLRNKRLKVSYARPSGDDIKDTNLYVTNLPRAITEEQLETIFGKYGRIVQKHILRDKSNGTPRGVAFVRYDKREEAQEAIAALNNVIPEGGTEPLSVKSCGRSADAAMARFTPVCSRSHSRSRLHSDTMCAEWGPEAALSRWAPSSAPATALCSRSHSRGRLHSDTMVAEEHGKQKAAYYAGWAAGFHHNRGGKHQAEPTGGKWPQAPMYTRRGPPPPPMPPHPDGDFAWGCGNCMMDPWDKLPPLGGSYPTTPRNGGCRPGACANTRIYPNYMPGKGTPRGRGRNMPWSPAFGEERFKGQRCRTGPSPYW